MVLASEGRLMPSKHDYSQPVPRQMNPQRGGTPRNTGSPPPDAPLDPFSHPPRTQSAKPQNAGRGEHVSPGAYAPQPGERPGERVKRPNLGMKGDDMGDKPKNMGDKPTGTVEPERRAAKDARGDGGVPGRVGTSDVMPGNWSLAPDPQEGYKPPGRARKP
jgi:hypothetical protein